MDVEEARKLKDEAEEKILDILQKLTCNTNMEIVKIEILRQSVSGYIQDRIVGVALTVEL